MIVVDTHVLVYFTAPSPHSTLVRRVYERDPDWSAPLLWRSEFRNAVVGMIRNRRISAVEAVDAFAKAVGLLVGREHSPDTTAVLRLALDHRLTAYDLEFVAVALQSGVRLITLDREILAEFPNVAVHPEEFAAADAAR